MVAIVDALCYSVSARQSAALPAVLYVFITGGNFIMTFQERLITLRKQQGLSQEQLGYELGVTTPDCFKMGAWCYDA